MSNALIYIEKMLPLINQLDELINYHGDIQQDYYEARAAFEASIKQFRHALNTTGIVEEQVEMMQFAMVALIDEMINKSQWHGKDKWLQSSLQFSCYQQEIAGEEFFTRLQSLCQAADTHRHVLVLYYVCMCLGFRGKYHGNSTILHGIMQQLKQELENALPPITWPTRQAKSKPERSQSILLLLGLVILFYIICATHLHTLESSVMRQLKEIHTNMQ